MTSKEMEKKRDELAVLWCKDHQFSEKDRGDSFKDGWDACAAEYEKEIHALSQVKEFTEWVASDKPYLSGQMMAEMAKRALKNDPSWKEYAD